MSCDIHTIVEVKKENTWVGVEECPKEFSERNYSMFAFLANVRNRFMTKGFEPKGFPEDMSEQSRELAEKWDSDMHSKSYLTLKELDDADKSDYLSVKCRVIGDFIKAFKEFGGVLPEQMTIEENKPTTFLDIIESAFCPDVIVKWQSSKIDAQEYPLIKGIEALKELAKKYNIKDYEDIRIVFGFDN